MGAFGIFFIYSQLHLIIFSGHNDIARLRLALGINEDDVPIQDAAFDHGISLDVESIGALSLPDLLHGAGIEFLGFLRVLPFWIRSRNGADEG